jgi:hypothetical protein
MKSFAYACLLTLALSACAAQPEQTLSEKLEGKTPEEKQEVLRLACLNEAEHVGKKPRSTTHGHRGHRHGDSAETKRLKDICREMTDNYAQKE